MPPKSKKKGFKAVSSKAVTKESLAYEDVENEHTITPKGPKSKPKPKTTTKTKTKSTTKTKTKTAEKSTRSQVTEELPASASASASRSGRKRQRAVIESDDNDDSANDGDKLPAKKSEEKPKDNGSKRKSRVPSPPTSPGEKPNQKEASPPSKKKKPNLKMKTNTNSSEKEETSNAKKAAAPARIVTDDAPAGTVKTYYPKIAFDHLKLVEELSESKGKTSKKRKSLSSTEVPKSHQEKACTLISSICSTELEGLKEYFSSSHSSRDNVLRSLETVLEQLPGAVEEHFSSSEDSVVFEPELSTREQSLLENRLKYLQKMTSEMEELQGYLENMSEMGETFGSSVIGVPVAPENAPTESGDSSCKEAEQMYAGHLDNMNKYVSTIQKRLGEINTDMSQARASQDELYDACQKVRFNQQATSATASDSSSTAPNSTPIFVSSRNFEASSKGGMTRSRSKAKQHATAKEALKKLQKM